MKRFSRSKKGKEHSSHHDASSSTAIAQQPGSVRQPGQLVQSDPNTSDLIDKYGLFLLNPQTPDPDGVEAEETYLLDIVAVHGITGDAYNTWTHENGKFWLQDFVPKKFPGARVFSFGYPAEVFF